MNIYTTKPVVTIEVVPTMPVFLEIEQFSVGEFLLDHEVFTKQLYFKDHFMSNKLVETVFFFL